MNRVVKIVLKPARAPSRGANRGNGPKVMYVMICLILVYDKSRKGLASDTAALFESKLSFWRVDLSKWIRDNAARAIRRTVRLQSLTTLRLAGQWLDDPPLIDEPRPHCMRVTSNAATRSQSRKVVVPSNDLVRKMLQHSSPRFDAARRPSAVLLLLWLTPAPRTWT